MITATRSTIYPHFHSHLLANKQVRNSPPLAAGYLSPAEETATKLCSQLCNLSPNFNNKITYGANGDDHNEVQRLFYVLISS